MALFLTVICAVTSLILWKIETKKTIKISPVSAIAVPYSCVMLLVAVYDIFSDDTYDKMGFGIPLISIAFILLFFLTGQIVMNLRKKRITKKKIFIRQLNGHLKKTRIGGRTFALLLIAFGLLFLAAETVLALRSGIKSTADFKAFFSAGVPGHTINLVSVAFLVVFYNKSKTVADYFAKACAVLWVVFLAVANAKYSMFLYALSLLVILVAENPKRFTFFRILVAIIIISLGFVITYAFRFLAMGYSIKKIPYKFIVEHFIYYLTCSFYAFSNALKTGASATENVGAGVFFAPAINVFRLIFGGEYVSNTSAFIDVKLINDYSSTNVYTLFGSLILEMGVMPTALCVILLGVIGYECYYEFITSENGAITPLYAFICANFALSFFNSFYGMMNVWEISLELFLIFLLNKLRKRKVEGREIKNKILYGEKR